MCYEALPRLAAGSRGYLRIFFGIEAVLRRLMSRRRVFCQSADKSGLNMGSHKYQSRLSAEEFFVARTYCRAVPSDATLAQTLCCNLFSQTYMPSNLFVLASGRGLSIPNATALLGHVVLLPNRICTLLSRFTLLESGIERASKDHGPMTLHDDSS